MVQPLLVSVSALTLATETVRSILKIDDVVRDQTTLWCVTSGDLSHSTCIISCMLIFFFLGMEQNSRKNTIPLIIESPPPFHLNCPL